MALLLSAVLGVASTGGEERRWMVQPNGSEIGLATFLWLVDRWRWIKVTDTGG